MQYGCMVERSYWVTSEQRTWGLKRFHDKELILTNGKKCLFAMPKFLRYSGTSILGPPRQRTSFQFDLQHSHFDLTIARWKRNFKKRRGRRKICEKVCAFERKKQASHLSWCKMHLDVWKSRSSHSHSYEKDLHWEKNPFIHGKNTIMIWRKVF